MLHLARHITRDANVVRLGKQFSSSDIFIAYNKKFILVQETGWPCELTLLLDEEKKKALWAGRL